MTSVDNITDQADQLTQVILPDGSLLQLELIFTGATERWSMNVTHPLLTTTGIALCNFPNMLRQWRNLIPFGVGCQTVTGVDLTDIEDFVNGNAVLYVLNQADVEAVEANIFGGVLQ